MSAPLPEFDEAISNEALLTRLRRSVSPDRLRDAVATVVVYLLIGAILGIGWR